MHGQWVLSMLATFCDEIGRMSVVLLHGMVELANDDVGAVVELCSQGALVDALYGVGDKKRERSGNHAHRCELTRFN